MVVGDVGIWQIYCYKRSFKRLGVGKLALIHQSQNSGKVFSQIKVQIDRFIVHVCVYCVSNKFMSL